MRVWPDYMGANRGGNVPKVTKAQEGGQTSAMGRPTQRRKRSPL